MAAELKMAPEPERLMVSEPEANALDAIVVGVALKFAKVPPTVATAATARAARLRRIFVSGRFLSMVRVSPFSPLTRSPSEPSAWRRGLPRNESRMSGWLLGLAPATEHEPAQREPEPEVPTAKPPTARALRHGESRCQRP